MRFMPSASFALVSLTLLGMAASRPAQAQTYNAADDFSTTNNPNGVWKYGYEAGNAPFTLYTSEGSFQNIDFWYLSGTGLPDIGKNNTAVTQGLLGPGKLMFHPGDNQATADYSSVVRWTAPAAGTYTFTTGFTGIDTRGLKVSVAIDLDGASVFSGDLSGLGSQLNSSETFTLAANDTIDYIVSNHYDIQTSQYDNVGDKNFVQLDASINPVPETSTLVSTSLLLCLGLGALALRARRRTTQPVE